MKASTPETERLNLALSIPTIKALRMLAVLTGETQNKVAEDLLIKGGLHDAVEVAWIVDVCNRPAKSAMPASQASPTPLESTDLQRESVGEVHTSESEHNPTPDSLPKNAPMRVEQIQEETSPRLRSRANYDEDIPW